MKGISPLIAAVLLIAFTMAIAGIMATWATTFVREEAGGISAKSQCVGALEIDSPKFDGTTLIITLKNSNQKINLTDLKAIVTYSDVTKNRQYELSGENVTGITGGDIPPLTTKWAYIETGDSTKPNKIEVFSSNCPDFRPSMTVQ